MCYGSNKRGTPLPDLIKMANYSHSEIEFIPYSATKSADVLLGINGISGDYKRFKRKVIHIGSVPSIHKNMKRVHKRNPSFLKNMDCVFFNSAYCRNIVGTRYKIKNKEVFLTFGGLPSDENMEPRNKSRRVGDEIHFVSVAKWYKRPYKRLKQTRRIFHKYLKKEYPNSFLHFIGCRHDKLEKDVYYHAKAFTSRRVVDILEKCHIQIMPTPFDTGPKTIPESLHYRIPFVCSDNCSGSEYISLLGKCGTSIKTDPDIKTWNDYREHSPLKNVKFYDKDINYEEYFEEIRNIINNYEEYTSWEWNEELNYKAQSDKLYGILKG